MDTLIELYDTNGTLLVSDDDGGAGLASRASYTFTRGSPIWCKVRHYSSSGTGSYTIRATATPITTPVPGPGSDDHSDTTQNATTLSVNAAAEAGSIGTGGDVDVFQLMQIVPAIFPPPTFTYVFETTVVGGMDTVIELLAADGTVLATNDDSPGMGYASKIVYTGQAGSAQYVRVRHYSSTGTGDYTVKASTQ
jgi:tyrosinase